MGFQQRKEQIAIPGRTELHLKIQLSLSEVVCCTFSPLGLKEYRVPDSACRSSRSGVGSEGLVYKSFEDAQSLPQASCDLPPRDFKGAVLNS